jgi:DME family drug/metabolite transporter
MPFLIHAAGGIMRLLSVFFLKEHLTVYKPVAFAVIMSGVYLICSFDGGISGSYSGITPAVPGRPGHVLSIFVSKLFRISSTLPQFAQFFDFGSLYLLIPLLYDGFTVPRERNACHHHRPDFPADYRRFLFYNKSCSYRGGRQSADH